MDHHEDRTRTSNCSGESKPSSTTSPMSTAASLPSVEASSSFFSLECQSTAVDNVRVFLAPLLLLQNETYFEKIPETSGCVLVLLYRTSSTMTASSSDTAADNNSSSSHRHEEWTLEALQQLLDDRNAHAWAKECFLTSPIDTSQEIQQSLDYSRASIRAGAAADPFGRMTTTAAAAGRYDLLWWKHHHHHHHQDGGSSLSLPPPMMCLRNLTKLRRILQNMTMIRSCKSDNATDTDNAKTTTTTVEPLQFSLAQVLLQCSASRDMTLQVLQQTFRALQSCTRTWTSKHNNNSVGCSTTTAVLKKEYRKLQQLLLHNLNSSSSSAVVPDNSMMDNLIMSSSSSSCRRRRLNFARRSCPDENERLQMLDVHAKRSELIQEFEENVKKKKRTIEETVEQQEQQPVMKNQFVVLTQEDYTEAEFLQETFFMQQVNATLHRVFDPLTSRPRLAQVALNADQVAGLRNIFFNPNGTLKESVARDAVHNSKHNYIEFQNAAAAGEKDKRWQIPIRRHGRYNAKKQTQKLNPTRSAVEESMSQAGILNTEFEHIHDMSLLVGGSQDQSLHHDLPRQHCIWQKAATSTSTSSSSNRDNQQQGGNTTNNNDISSDDDELVGWEVNRLLYNHDMAHRYAPSGMVIGMGSTNSTILLGVQKDQLEREPADNRRSNNNDDGSGGVYCRIRNGRPTERFEIVRENRHLAVLKVPIGCVFTGDFPHAGVCNFYVGTPEYALMVNLVKKIDAIAKEHDKKRRRRRDFAKLSEEKAHAALTRDLLNMFCQFQGLNRICRLHVSTELNETTMVVPRNTVGYYRCHANPPDGHGGRSNTTTTVSSSSTCAARRSPDGDDRGPHVNSLAEMDEASKAKEEDRNSSSEEDEDDDDDDDDEEYCEGE